MKEKITEDYKLSENDGLYFLEYTCKNITIEISRNIVKDRIEFTNHTKSYFFVNGTNVKSFDKPSRDYFSSSEGTQFLGGVAIFSKSILSTFLANFLINVKLTKSEVPIKVFNDRNEAIIWLNKIKNQNMLLVT
jgi:hypothetical protein